jgi:hypothetical protein
MMSVPPSSNPATKPRRTVLYDSPTVLAYISVSACCRLSIVLEWYLDAENVR